MDNLSPAAQANLVQSCGAIFIKHCNDSLIKEEQPKEEFPKEDEEPEPTETEEGTGEQYE